MPHAKTRRSRTIGSPADGRREQLRTQRKIVHAPASSTPACAGHDRERSVAPRAGADEHVTVDMYFSVLGFGCLYALDDDAIGVGCKRFEILGVAGQDGATGLG